MIGMHMYMVVAAGVAVALLAAVGGVAAVVRWVPPLGRGRVLRPRLWGYGTLVSALGLGLFEFLGPLGNAGLDFLPLAGWFVFMGGLAVQSLARRPGRPRRPRRSATASVS